MYQHPHSLLLVTATLSWSIFIYREGGITAEPIMNTDINRLPFFNKSIGETRVGLGNGWSSRNTG